MSSLGKDQRLYVGNQTLTSHFDQMKHEQTVCERCFAASPGAGGQLPLALSTLCVQGWFYYQHPVLR